MMIFINGHQSATAAQMANAAEPFDFLNFIGTENMKQAIQAVVLASLLTSFSAFAHHPAEAIVDAETWEMIDQNLEDVDSPHLDIDFTMM